MGMFSLLVLKLPPIGMLLSTGLTAHSKKQSILLTSIKISFQLTAHQLEAYAWQSQLSPLYIACMFFIWLEPVAILPGL